MFPDASNWTVLIVDDDEDNLGVPRQVLEFIGAEVYTAQDGRQGLELLKMIMPTFVLLDLSMPVMDGWTMLKAVREKVRFADLPVIALTAHAMPGDHARVMEAGFNGYISKPFMLNTFLDEIQRCLDSLQFT